MSDRSLEATGIAKSFGGRAALSGVDLTAQPGQLHGLLGPNGAGKTTLMRVLLGLVQRDAGSIRMFGRDVESMGRVLDGVAGLVETPSFYPYLSGRQNLSVLARLDGLASSTRRERIETTLEQVGLASHSDVRVAGYSAGMRQRLGLAAAMIRSPRLLFLDEPTTSLDPRGAHDVRALIRRLADDGAAVVLSSHDMAEVEDLCATVTVVDHGRVIFSGAVDELRMRAPSTIHALQTSDDHRALELASARPGMRVRAVADTGLEVRADADAIDAYVIALGCAGVAVRSLERRVRSLESLFLELTNTTAAGEAAVSSIATAPDRQHASMAVS
jgi:ABC-2 type transport system ATP-binding protein